MALSSAQNSPPSVVYELFSTLSSDLHAVFTWVCLSLLLNWEFVHHKFYKFSLSKAGLGGVTSQSDVNMHEGYSFNWEV